MKHSTTRSLYEYWDNLRGHRPAPDRSEVEPGQIRSLLGDTFILEVIDPVTYRFRLAGTRLCSLHCRELKSRNILRGWRGEDNQALATLLAAVSDDAGAAVLGVSGHTEREQTIDMEMLLLPLHVPGEGCSRVLGSCVALQQPYWAGLHPILSQSIKSVRLLWPNEKPAFLSSGLTSSVPAAGEHQYAAAGVVPGGRQVGHLTVLDGGKI
ncbi:PAS domain-containing protein [Rhizobiales bacterium]|uniref:PAS domain-containing protein n=1 Tax=Hongsoonwoonella zoysiae TaxID=2821844 RepID=UPI00155FB4AB|nr:PAS domain-containing protein [Hongsoonwoonella zoysiae]NRG18121.1 PAS domain-containing protein [Hongsoonwoonella zoysiae]